MNIVFQGWEEPLINKIQFNIHLVGACYEQNYVLACILLVEVSVGILPTGNQFSNLYKEFCIVYIFETVIPLPDILPKEIIRWIHSWIFKEEISVLYKLFQKSEEEGILSNHSMRLVLLWYQKQTKVSHLKGLKANFSYEYWHKNPQKNIIKPNPATY